MVLRANSQAQFEVLSMSHPIVFISHSKLKEGKLEAFRELSEEGFSVMGAATCRWRPIDYEGGL